MKLAHETRPEQTESANPGATEAAVHIAWVAETLASMPADMATSMSATQRVAPEDLSTIRRLIPTLTRQYQLRARLEEESGFVTVWFGRRRR